MNSTTQLCTSLVVLVHCVTINQNYTATCGNMFPYIIIIRNNPKTNSEVVKFYFRIPTIRLVFISILVAGCTEHFTCLLKGQPKCNRPRCHTYPNWQKSFVQRKEAFFAYCLLHTIECATIPEAATRMNGEVNILCYINVVANIAFRRKFYRP